MGECAAGESERDFQLHSESPATASDRRANREYIIGGGSSWVPGFGELCGQQGGNPCIDEGGGTGIGASTDYGECSCARFYQYGHSSRVAGGDCSKFCFADSAGAFWRGGGCGFSCGVPLLGGGKVYNGTGHPGEWRVLYVRQRKVQQFPLTPPSPRGRGNPDSTKVRQRFR